MSELQGRRRAARQVLFAALWVTLLVLTMKLWIGGATRSVSLLAESLHTLITSFSLLLSLIALSSRCNSDRDLWGHGRGEALLALILVALLGFAGLSLLVTAGSQLSQVLAEGDPSLPMQTTLPLLQLLGVIVPVCLCWGFFARFQARLLDNSRLRLNASQTLQDGWLTLIVLAGWWGYDRGYTWLDPTIAGVMVLMAIASTWQVFSRQLPAMLRQMAIAPEAIAKTVHQVEGILHCYGIQSRGMVGRLVYVEMRLILHPEFASVAQFVVSRVEQMIRQHYGAVKVVVFLDQEASDS